MSAEAAEVPGHEQAQSQAIVDARCSTVRVHHPALEAEAAVAVLREWLDAGISARSLAVVLPRRNDVLVGQLAAAAARADVPLATRGQRLGDHPLVFELAQSLKETPGHGDESLADRAFAWWLDHAAELLADPMSAQLVGAFHAALERTNDLSQALNSRPWNPRHGTIAVVGIDHVHASPRSWKGVVVLQCVDGVLPRRQTRPTPSDPHGPADPTGSIDVEEQDRQRVLQVLDATDASGEIVAVVTNVGGLLPSRFVDGWRQRDLALVRPAGTRRPARPVTTNAIPVFPSGSLRLSATQLTTFEDCSWRYAFEYGLGVRGAGGAAASAGTLVHAVLEAFLRADGLSASERTLERLLELLDETWDASAFPYNAQALDYRRRAEQWLANWWEHYRVKRPTVAHTEYRFTVPFPAGDPHPPHTIVGSIDRLDVVAPLTDGDEPITRVVDYKSGSPKRQADIDVDLQLAIYHYAATNDPDLRALGRPEHLELHYLQDGFSKDRVKVMARGVTDDLEAETTERIAALAEAILAEGYEPNVDATCDYCAFQTLCPIQREGQHVG